MFVNEWKVFNLEQVLFQVFYLGLILICIGIEFLQRKGKFGQFFKIFFLEVQSWGLKIISVVLCIVWFMDRCSFMNCLSVCNKRSIEMESI